MSDMAQLLYTANRIGVRVIVGKRSAKGVVLGEVASDCIYECEHVVTVRVNYSCDPIRAAPGAVRLPTSSPVSDGRAVQPFVASVVETSSIIDDFVGGGRERRRRRRSTRLE